MEKIRGKRGSEQLMAVWKARALSDEAVREIAQALEASPAIVLGGNIVGGARPTGVTLSLAYKGDDVAKCGNDIMFWLRWHLVHAGGGEARPPRIAINGVPRADLVRIELDFGHLGPHGPAEVSADLDDGGLDD